MYIEIYLNIDTKTWSCLYQITDYSKMYQMEAMLSGNHILMEKIDDDTKLYSGDFKSKNWFESVCKMYGYKINIVVS